MDFYTVLYKDKDDKVCDVPQGFRCQATDTDHAEKQIEEFAPEALIVWVSQTDSYPEALRDWANKIEIGVA